MLCHTRTTSKKQTQIDGHVQSRSHLPKSEHQFVRWLLVTFVGVLLLANFCLAADAAPQKINYQGLLKDSGGNPVTGTVSITFKIYDAASGGSVLWQETHGSVAVDEGGFSVVLGEGDVPAALGDAVFSASERWLGITIGTDPELAPRTQMVSVPYSQRVSTVDRASAGAIAGQLEIIPDAAKLADGSMIVRGANSCDAVTINPTADIALEAMNDNCEQVMFLGAANDGGVLELNATDAVKSLTRTVQIDPAQGVALRNTELNGDETVSITSNPQGGSVLVTSTDVAKALARSVEIAPSQGLALRATEQNGDETISLLSQPSGGMLEVHASDALKALSRTVRIAPSLNEALKVTEQNGDDVLLLSADQNGGAIEVNASDALKGTSRSVRIAPALGQALRVTEQNGDDVLLLSSDANGGAIEINVSDALKADPNAVTSTVTLAPGNGSILKAIDNGGNTLVELKEESGAGKIVLSTASSKAIQKQVEITEDGIVFWNNTLTDTNMIISAQGSIIGKGKMAMGAENVNAGSWANVLGYNNEASGDSSSVLGGYSNIASGFNTVVCGGSYDTASGDWSIVGGGRYNHASGGESVISGGVQNRAAGNRAVVSGGLGNFAYGYNSSIGGGIWNEAYNQGTIAGGRFNRASGEYSTIGGGGGPNQADTSLASGYFSTIGGGRTQYATGDYATIGGGAFNKARGLYSVVAGGGGATAADSNSASGLNSTVGGGIQNVASQQWATVAGGFKNHATAFGSAILGGSTNLASGNLTICLGTGTNARGNFSGTIGRFCNSNHSGSWVIAANSSSSSSDSVSSGGNEQLVMRADGGIYLTNTGGTAPYDAARLINTSTGAYLTTGGTWTDASDRNLKEHFSKVDAQALLEKLRELPVTEWNYKAEGDNVKRIGPMGQDFYRIFGYGADEKSLSARDLASIAVVAIQELDRKTSEIDDLKSKMAKMEAIINQLLEDRQ
jgi:hypothetical protein